MSRVVLPNYFLADLPAEAVIRGELVAEACLTLKRNRERFLQTRSTESILQILLETARAWQGPQSVWRAMALEEGPARTGFSREMIALGLDAYFKLWTARQLNALLQQEFAHPQRVDRLVANDSESLGGLTSRVRGPELLVHVTAGRLPTPVFTALLHGLLVKSAQFVKCASGGSFFARLFAHSLREIEPKIASCLEIAEWKGGTRDLEEALYAGADCVVASGSDATMDAVRATVPSRVRFLAHGHRVSAAYIAREMLGSDEEPNVTAAAAMDVAMWDQLGCLSPHVIFVEQGGMLAPEGFAARLADELERVEARWPRGTPAPEVSDAVFRRREFYRVRAAADPGTQCWFSRDSTAWSVVYEGDPQFQLSCLNRFVIVKPVETVEECLRQAEAQRTRWSTVGLAASGLRIPELAQRFAEWGITRICPLGRMQHPPLTWRHDGRPVLGDLVTWAQQELPWES
ncbi:MAG: hypothetical protein IT580_07490 [Verrucomicrobiales bacterium]|nr:hypothetical protein [Verrucomicrobiales bacterium]